MNSTCIIQARMTSTRLPGKILFPLASKPMIIRVVERVRKAKLIDKIIVAISDNEADNVVGEWVKSLNDSNIVVFRGSEKNVLDRYYQAAKGSETIIRITSDCPLIDWKILDNVIAQYMESKVDYVSNTLNVLTYPRGLDVEVFSFHALEKAWKEGSAPEDKEHVTHYIRTHPELFSTKEVRSNRDLSSHRWTVDEYDDYVLISKIYDLLKDDLSFTTEDILQLFKTHPELTKINQHVRQKST